MSVAQPLMITRSLSSRLISSIAPLTSSLPRRRAVCTAAIKLAPSDTVAFVKAAIAGVFGAATGRVSHNTATNPDKAAQPPIAHPIHGRVWLNALRPSFLCRRVLSGLT
jgi:hypothetical protein